MHWIFFYVHVSLHVCAYGLSLENISSLCTRVCVCVCVSLCVWMWHKSSVPIMHIEFLLCSLYLSALIWQMRINRWSTEERESGTRWERCDGRTMRTKSLHIFTLNWRKTMCTFVKEANVVSDAFTKTQKSLSIQIKCFVNCLSIFLKNICICVFKDHLLHLSSVN